jgi:hypothetical protein
VMGKGRLGDLWSKLGYWKEAGVGKGKERIDSPLSMSLKTVAHMCIQPQ